MCLNFKSGKGDLIILAPNCESGIEKDTDFGHTPFFIQRNMKNMSNKKWLRWPPSRKQKT